MLVHFWFLFLVPLQLLCKQSIVTSTYSMYIIFTVRKQLPFVCLSQTKCPWLTQLENLKILYIQDTCIQSLLYRIVYCIIPFYSIRTTFNELMSWEYSILAGLPCVCTVGVLPRRPSDCRGVRARGHRGWRRNGRGRWPGRSAVGLHQWRSGACRPAHGAGPPRPAAPSC